VADPQHSLPLRPKVFHVLLALSGQAQHGYGLKKSIRDRTSGTVDLDPGGLYRLISRLEDDGLIELAPSPEGSEDDPRRRYYALTAFGQDVLRAEARRLSEITSWADVAALARSDGAL
jgi:DNA-binding PadR family transcriptional regulator